MHRGTDAFEKLIAMGVADAIVLFGWVGIAAVVIHVVNGRVDRAQPGDAGPGDLAPLFYIVSLLFWPAALVSGLHFLGRPGGARAGRICLFLFLGHITFSVLIAIAITLYVVLRYPHFLP